MANVDGQHPKNAVIASSGAVAVDRRQIWTRPTLRRLEAYKAQTMTAGGGDGGTSLS